MEFRTYTYKGLETKLHQELSRDQKNFELIKRINNELKERGKSFLKTPVMSPNEMIHWILEDTDFEKIVKIVNQSGLEPYSVDRMGDTEITVITLMDRAKRLLDSVVRARQGDYEGYHHQSGGLVAERNIIDGVMTLRLYYKIGGWDMDYEAVTSENWCEPEEDYKGEIND